MNFKLNLNKGLKSYLTLFTGNRKRTIFIRFNFVQINYPYQNPITMLKNLLVNKPLTSYLLILLITLTCSCKKSAIIAPEKGVEKNIILSYEVNCDYCDITYTDQNNQSKTIRNTVGTWTYKIDTKINFNLKLAVKTVLTTYQTIQAYILKEGEVVYGNLGYNTAELAYNPYSNQGTASFGSYIVAGSNGGSSGSGGSSPVGGSANPTSSVCGAKNKTGGYCKRVVIGGGRCWQHK